MKLVRTAFSVMSHGGTIGTAGMVSSLLPNSAMDVDMDACNAAGAWHQTSNSDIDFAFDEGGERGCTRCSMLSTMLHAAYDEPSGTQNYMLYHHDGEQLERSEAHHCYDSRYAASAATSVR